MFSFHGRATVYETALYKLRNPKVAKTSWRQLTNGLNLSSIGIGTCIGPPCEATDILVTNAIVQSVSSGVLNYIDTAINYRQQKAERSVGKAVEQLILSGINRNEFFISSKIGYIPDDAENKISAKSLIASLKKQNLITDQDIIGGVHCMHPEFLKNQLNQSLKNLQIDTLDLLCLYDTAEVQLPIIGEEAYMKRLAAAFEFCESQKDEGKIMNYGLASWICFRSPVGEKDLHLSLEKVVKLAEKVAGPEHSMKFVQLPINFLMPEVFMQKWQKFKGSEEIFLNVAKELGINVIAAAPLAQGKIIGVKLAKAMTGVNQEVSKILQFIRSIPSSALKSVLVGMKTPGNVAQNMQLPYVECLAADEFWNILKPKGCELDPVNIKLC